jgi:hypothetical protein
MNKSFAVHSFELSAAQGFEIAEFNDGVMLAKGEGLLMDQSFTVHS